MVPGCTASRNFRSSSSRRASSSPRTDTQPLAAQNTEGEEAKQTEGRCCSRTACFFCLLGSFSQSLSVSVPEMKQVRLPDRYTMTFLRTKPQICICFLPQGQLSAALLLGCFNSSDSSSLNFEWKLSTFSAKSRLGKNENKQPLNERSRFFL